MRTLVIETATEACSAALFEGGALVAGSYEVLGRGHAERLVPMISELPEKGCAQLIIVSLGPGHRVDDRERAGERIDRGTSAGPGLASRGARLSDIGAGRRDGAGK